MAHYPSILRWLLLQEDASLSAKTVDLSDGAGVTRLGLTSRNQPKAVTDGFFEMSLEDALTYAGEYYRAHFWNAVRGDEINSDTVAAPLFSFAVNDGPSRAIKELQAAAGVQVDGIIGAGTLAAVNGTDPDTLAATLQAQQAQFYRDIAPTHPVIANDLNGLLKRAARKFPSLL
jgi:lysozyme family protein